MDNRQLYSRLVHLQDHLMDVDARLSESKYEIEEAIAWVKKLSLELTK